MWELNSRMKRYKDLKYLTGILISGIVIIILLEGLMWVLPLPMVKTLEFEGGYASESWGYRLAPNARVIQDRGTHTYTVLTDDDGITYRSPLKNSQKTILFIGDSFTQGTQEASYTKDFWNLLKAKLGDQETPEVISGGVGGYSFWEAYNWFNNYGINYDPDLVVYGFFFNDITGYSEKRQRRISNSRPGIRIYDPEIEDVTYWNGIFTPHPFDTLKFLRRNSRLLQFIDRTIDPPQPYGLQIRDSWVRELSPTLSAVEHAALNRTFELLTELKAYQESRGGNLAILFIPDGSEVIIEDIKPRYYLEVMEFCAQQNLHCIDPLSPLRSAHKTGEKVYWNEIENADAHTTPAGHAILAETLATRYMQTDGFSRMSTSVVDSNLGKQKSFPQAHPINNWTPEIRPYQVPSVTFNDGALNVAVEEASAGIMLNLPVDSGQSLVLRINVEILDGQLTVRFRDGEKLNYFSAKTGRSEYIIQPNGPDPELLLYSDADLEFRLNEIALTPLNDNNSPTINAVFKDAFVN